MPTTQHDYSEEQPQLLDPQASAEPSPGVETSYPGQQAVTVGYSRRCPTCHAPTGAFQTVCPQCGTRQQMRAEVIRCRHCGQRSSSQLVLCSHCGRELQAATSRFLTLGLPGILVLLFVLVLSGQLGLGSPLGWVQRQMTGSLQVINNIAITPVRADDVNQTAGSTDTTGALVALRPLAPSTQDTPSPLPLEDSAAVVSPDAVGVASMAELTPLSEAENNESSGDQGNDGDTLDTTIVVAAATQTLIATATPAATATPIATATSTSTETAVPTETSIADSVVETTATGVLTGTLPSPTVTATGTGTGTASFFVARGSPSATVRSTAIPSQTVRSSQAVTLSQTVTPSQGITEASINLDINATLAAIRAGVTPTATLPTATVTTTAIPTETPAPFSTFTVRAGDTLLEISEQFGIPMAELMAVNGLTARAADNLAVGRVLILPGIASIENERTQTYVVRSGDTFVSIALRFNVDIDALLRINGRTTTSARDLTVGQTIIVPTSSTASNALQIYPVPTTVRPTDTPTPAPTEYTVQTGDTVVSIARRFGTTSQVLLAFNNLSEAGARSLQPGDILLIPPPGQR